MDSLIPFLADGLVFVIVILAAYLLIAKVPNAQKYPKYARMLVAGLTSYLAAKIMSIAYQPTAERPFEILNVEPGASFLDNPGFPSDHALFVWVIVFAVLYVYRNRWVAILLIMLASLVCIGRVLALVHAPIDVIGGIFAAMIGALWYLDERNATKRLVDLPKNKK